MHLVRTQNLQKTNISYLVMYTRTCAYQGVEIVSFTKILRTYSGLYWNFHWNCEQEIRKLRTHKCKCNFFFINVLTL